MTVVNPRLLVVDDNLRRFERARSVDLLATNAPTVGTGRYVCFEEKVPKGQCLVIGGMAVWAKQRINVGAADESNEMIDPKDGNGWFSFEPQINDAVLKGYLPVIDLATPRLLTTGGVAPTTTNLNNDDRQQRAGLTMLSLEPDVEAHRQWNNALFRFLVPSDAVFRVVFSILPPSASAPLDATGRYTIGVGATKRVDYAGVHLLGMQMTEQSYEDLKRQASLEHMLNTRM